MAIPQKACEMNIRAGCVAKLPVLVALSVACACAILGCATVPKGDALNDQITLGEAYRFHRFLEKVLPKECYADIFQFQHTSWGGIHYLDGEVPYLAEWQIVEHCPPDSDRLLFIFAFVPRGGAKRLLFSWGKYDIDETYGRSNGVAEADEYVAALRQHIIRGSQLNLTDPACQAEFEKESPPHAGCNLTFW
jgi:hypothetical protein